VTRRNLPPTLVDTTAKNFTVRECSADKGYSSSDNHDAIDKHGGTPFIAFKDNTTAKNGGLFRQMWHFFSLHREESPKHYHKRSNVDSAFSMIKAKFGDAVRLKTDVAI
jgi:transposase